MTRLYTRRPRWKEGEKYPEIASGIYYFLDLSNSSDRYIATQQVTPPPPCHSPRFSAIGRRLVVNQASLRRRTNCLDRQLSSLNRPVRPNSLQTTMVVLPHQTPADCQQNLRLPNWLPHLTCSTLQHMTQPSCTHWQTWVTTWIIS